MSDVRQALRLLRKSPLLTISIVLIVGLGIGASTTIFSVVNAILVRPLPFEDPLRLVQVAEKNDALRLNAFGVSALNYLSWTEGHRTFAGLGAIQFGTYTLTGQGDPETYPGNAITTSLMPLLGLRPVAGRTFAAGEDRPGGAPVVMLGEALWRRRFGADPGLVGRAVTVNGVGYTVVGIAPTALTTLTNGELWVPLVIDPAKEIRLNHVLFVVGRLKPQVAMAAAQTDMDGVASRMRGEYPELKDWGVNVISFTDTFVSPSLRRALLVLLGAAIFVLVIVSANVANLLLARSIERQREMAIRLALGAGALRLWRQLLVESLVLSALGGAAGLAAATWGSRALEAALPPNLLPVPGLGVDPTVVAFALAVTALTGLVFGLAPAWQASRVALNETLNAAGRSAVGGVRPWLRKGLAGAELALATVLLVGAALLARSLLELQRVPLGFEPQGVTAFQVALPPTRYDNARRVAFHRDLVASLRAIPGVRAAAVSSGIPFGVGNYTTSPVEAPGSGVLPAGASVPIDWRTVSPDLFATLRIPLLRGRDFTDGDTGTAPDVMVVSRATAHILWGDADPIGRIVRRVADRKDFTVVGVVGDVRSATLGRESPALYYSAGTRVWPLMDVVLRTDADVAGTMAAVRREVRRLDPSLALSNARPMGEWVTASAAQPRLNAALLGVFATVALLVAAIGTYGVLAYSVSRRTREIGLRLALGAERRDVLSLVVREGMLTAGIGLGLGLGVALGASRALASLLFGISAFDLATYAGVAGLLAAVSLVACLLPALRAARVSPLEALRLD